jgi:hypothetical protein
LLAKLPKSVRRASSSRSSITARPAWCIVSRSESSHGVSAATLRSGPDPAAAAKSALVIRHGSAGYRARAARVPQRHCASRKGVRAAQWLLRSRRPTTAPTARPRPRPSSTAPRSPTHFGSIEDARAFCAEVFNYYNHEHYHSGLGLHTPASVHFGTAETIRADRAQVLAIAYAQHPERFSQLPVPPKLPTAAWINHPAPPPIYR